MEKATMCTYPQSDHALPHFKCVLPCCVECPCINIPDQETDNQYSETTPSIRFHINHIIGRCTSHGRILLKDKKIFYMCKQESSSDNSTKIYTRKELVMTETKITYFHTTFYITAIQKLEFHLTQVHIIGKNNCGKMWRTAFKRRELFQDVPRRRDYAEGVVEKFVHQIQSEYYGGNISVSIEGISLENFNAWPNANINSTTPSHQRHAVFHSSLSDDSKQDAATINAKSKRLNSFLKDKKYWQHHWVKYGETPMVLMNNRDVDLHYT